MEFRTASRDDIPRIIELWDVCGLASGVEQDTREIEERLREPDGFFVLGEIDGMLVAGAMGCYDNHRGWVKRVAISPEQRGKGLGRMVVAELERRFLGAGISKLRLAVWDENESALEFWNRMDYVELPDIRYFTKDLLD
ncbi:MAG: GNAT family N-acetyltransferase [Acidimicrobiales bacterium]|nr:MAG: GNAT family N-acetyltransferase [Acidimicrobiales bacterium]